MVRSQRKLHHRLRGQLRACFGLGACLACCASWVRERDKDPARSSGTDTRFAAKPSSGRRGTAAAVGLRFRPEGLATDPATERALCGECTRPRPARPDECKGDQTQPRDDAVLAVAGKRRGPAPAVVRLLLPPKTERCDGRRNARPVALAAPTYGPGPARGFARLPFGEKRDRRLVGGPSSEFAGCATAIPRPLGSE